MGVPVALVCGQKKEAFKVAKQAASVELVEMVLREARGGRERGDQALAKEIEGFLATHTPRGSTPNHT